MKPILCLFVAVLGCVAVMQAQDGGATYGGGARPTEFAPLDYFSDKCARCHGAYGSFYGANFAKGKTNQQLAQAVKDMCDGPAQAPLVPHDLDILTAWHRALRDGVPFVVVTKFENGVLSGEASPGSRVILQTTTGIQTETPLMGHKWNVGLPEGVKIARIRVVLNDKTSELDASQTAYAPR